MYIENEKKCNRKKTLAEYFYDSREEKQSGRFFIENIFIHFTVSRTDFYF